MTKQKPTRRKVISTALGAAGLASLGAPALARDLTPRAAEGPYYPTPQMRRPDVDNDLVRIAGAVRDAGGDVIRLSGRVLDGQGKPLPNHRVEIWQCDFDGRYLHARDSRSVGHDAAFQGFGHDITGADGGYTFRTIMPVSYPGRTPHIHVKVLDGSREVLTTQFYIEGHPANDRDALFRRMSAAEAQAVSMIFTGRVGLKETRVDIVV